MVWNDIWYVSFFFALKYLSNPPLHGTIPEKIQMGGGGGGRRGCLRIYYFKKLRGFLICHFTLANSGENKLWPLDILRDCVTPLGNSKFKNQDPGNSRWIFLDHLWKFHFLFNWPLEFSQALSSMPLKMPFPQPPSPFLFGFYLE